jgi:hypothetical protein
MFLNSRPLLGDASRVPPEPTAPVRRFRRIFEPKSPQTDHILSVGVTLFDALVTPFRALHEDRCYAAPLAAQTARPRSEAGVGAPTPWADPLWATTCNSTCKGRGFYRIDEKLRGQLVDTRDCAHANRLVYKESGRRLIGLTRSGRPAIFASSRTCATIG